MLGIASNRIVHGALDVVRSSSKKVVVHCKFIARYVDGHPEYRDLLK